MIDRVTKHEDIEYLVDHYGLKSDELKVPPTKCLLLLNKPDGTIGALKCTSIWIERAAESMLSEFLSLEVTAIGLDDGSYLSDFLLEGDGTLSGDRLTFVYIEPGQHGRRSRAQKPRKGGFLPSGVSFELVKQGLDSEDGLTLEHNRKLLAAQLERLLVSERKEIERYRRSVESKETTVKLLRGQ